MLLQCLLTTFWITILIDGDPPDADYDKQEFGSNAMRSKEISELHRRICYNQTVYDDTRLEATEYAGLTLEVQELQEFGGRTTVNTVVDIKHTAIKILDNDGEQNYYITAFTLLYLSYCADLPFSLDWSGQGVWLRAWWWA